jgi:LL-diaminopimelate aminotransferase
MSSAIPSTSQKERALKLSQRLQSLPPYHFAEYARKIAELRASGVDVISLSMGDPDLPTPPEVLDALAQSARQPLNQRYPEYAGLPQLREAFAAWFGRRFGVMLDPARELMPLIGSKEGLAHLPLAIIDEGDVALMPDPNYPVYPTAVALAGGTCCDLPLDADGAWLPDLDAIPEAALSKATTLWLNYPNNPTGAIASPEFYEGAVRFAHAHNLLLINDMAYCETWYGDYRPHSLLEIEGAKDVAVEFYSFSKAYNMGGFRIGMLVGNPTVIEGMTRLKSNLDTGIFRPIQYAAIRALDLPETWLAQRNSIYQRRRDLVVAACQRLGMTVTTPSAGLYIWPRVPNGYTASAFAMELLQHTGVAVTPGTNFGAHGEGYVRISLTIEDARLDTALERMDAMVSAHR